MSERILPKLGPVIEDIPNETPPKRFGLYAGDYFEADQEKADLQVKQQVKTILQAKSIADLKPFENSTHPEIKQALVHRLALEARQAPPDLELKYWLLQKSDPKTIKTLLDQIIAGKSSKENFNPKVLETLILGSANLPQVLFDILNLKKLFVGGLLTYLNYALLSGLENRFYSLINLNMHNDIMDEQYIKLYEIFRLLNDASILTLSVITSIAGIKYPMSAKKLAAQYGLQLNAKDETKINYLFSTLMPFLSNFSNPDVFYTIRNKSFIAALKDLPQDSDPLTKEFLLNCFSAPPEKEKAEAGRLVEQILKLNDPETIEAMSRYYKSDKIVDKLLDIAHSKTNPIDKAQLLFKASVMFNEINGYSEQALTTMFQAIEEATRAGEGGEAGFLKLMALKEIGEWARQYYSSPADIFASYPEWKKKYLDYVLELSRPSGGKAGTVESLKLRKRQELISEYGELFTEILLSNHTKTLS